MSFLDNATFRLLLPPHPPFMTQFYREHKDNCLLKILKYAVSVGGTAGSLTIVLPWQHRIHQSGAPVKFLFPPLQSQIIV